MTTNSSKKELNEQLLNKLKIRIYSEEKQNAKTRKKSDTEMVELIRKIIQLEVDRSDN